MTTESSPPAVPQQGAPAGPAHQGQAGGAAPTLPITKNEGPIINATPQGAGDGVIRCVKCGASEVQINPKNGLFLCAFCRHEWGEERLDEVMKLSEGIGDLKGTTLSSAAVDITDDGTLVTLKCSGCGAEVVVDTAQNLQARCHWCKHVLAINNRIPNGAVPDGILPFTVTRQQAMARIGEFVSQRSSFAHPEFKKSFRLENVMGVYMPYMTVDGNMTARLDGVGEVLTGTVRVSDKRTDYKADEFTVTRHLSMEIDDLIVETSSDKVNIKSNESTNNIINAVLPFDVKNIVRFNSNFLGADYTSERRDMNIEHAESYAADHFMTIARGAVQPSISGYTRGVRWEAEQLNIKGSRWTAVLLPVWLYGFVETKNGKKVTHYLAVNGRTGATMGSVPINTAKAALVSWGTAIGISIITWPIAFIVMATS